MALVSAEISCNINTSPNMQPYIYVRNLKILGRKIVDRLEWRAAVMLFFTIVPRGLTLLLL
jgi:hypothetical protein